MATSAVDNQHPRFGFNAKLIISQTLTDAALVGTGVTRPSGFFDATVVGVFTLTGGAGSVNMVLEGSNDGSNWFALGQLPNTDYFTATSQKVLAATANQIVGAERFMFLRVRAAVTAGAPTFTLQIFVCGIAVDSEKFLETNVFTRTGATVNQATPSIRPRGVSFVEVQITTSALVLGGATAIQIAIQGSPNFVAGMPTVDQVWEDLATSLVTAVGSQMIAIAGDRLIDLAGYNRFRIQLTDVGGVSTSYTITTRLAMDSGDWIEDSVPDGSGGSPIPGLETGLLSILFGAPGVEAGDTIVLPFQVIDSTGSPVVSPARIEFDLSDTSQAGDFDLASTAVFSAVGGGASAIAGIGTNRVLVNTSGAGAGTLSVLDAAVETVYVSGAQPKAPVTTQIVWDSEEATLTFA